MSQAKYTQRPSINMAVASELGPQILQRDQFACQVCGAEEGDPDLFRRGASVRLTLGYITARPKLRRDVADNIRTECTNCNEGFRNIPLPKSSRIELLKQVRRARIDDQRAVLEWLQQRFQSGR